MSINSVYEQYFGLEEHPFSITPDPRFIYLSESHRAALEHLKQGAVGGANGFVLLTGDVGTGKTTICRTFLEHVPPKTEVALILNPVLTLNEFLQTICEELDLAVSGSRESNKNLIDHLNRFLLQVYAVGQKTILIVDEAQNLSHELLEQIRLLTNLETNTDKLLQIFLIGQPELRETLERPDLLQVSQRITSRYHLGPLNKDETRNYILKRLEVAGTQSISFTGGAIRRIYAYTKGVPRLINVLCDKALLSAYERSTDKINDRIIKDAEDRIRGNLEPEGGNWFRVAAGFGAIALLSAAVLGAAYSLNIANMQPWLDGRLAAIFGDDSVVATVPDGTTLARNEPMPARPAAVQAVDKEVTRPAPTEAAGSGPPERAPAQAVMTTPEAAQAVTESTMAAAPVAPDSAQPDTSPQARVTADTDVPATVPPVTEPPARPATLAGVTAVTTEEPMPEPAVAVTDSVEPSDRSALAGTTTRAARSATSQALTTQSGAAVETAIGENDGAQPEQEPRTSALIDLAPSPPEQAGIEPVEQDAPAPAAAAPASTDTASVESEPATPSADDLGDAAESELLARIDRMESLLDAVRSDLTAPDAVAQTAADNPQQATTQPGRAMAATQQQAGSPQAEPAPRFAIAEPEVAESPAGAQISAADNPVAPSDRAASTGSSPAKPEQVAKAEPAQSVETAPAPAASTDDTQTRPATRPAGAARRPPPQPRAGRSVPILTNYTQQAAERKLLSLWGVEKEPPSGIGFCEFARRNGLNCLTEGRGLPFLYVYNRPAMISMKIDDVYSYAVVTRATPDNIVIDVLGRTHSIPSSVLPSVWDGRSLILWRGSDEFSGEVVQGDRGRPVESLRQLIDEIEGKSTTGNVYDAELVARVKKFQRDVGLKPDGIFGPRTHMVMQNKLAQLEKK